MGSHKWLNRFALIYVLSGAMAFSHPIKMTLGKSFSEIPNSRSVMNPVELNAVPTDSILPFAIGLSIDSAKMMAEVPLLSKIALSVSVAGYNYWYYKGLKPVWWDGDGAHFHVINDWYKNYALEQDKFSHFFAAQFLARQWAAICESLGWPTSQAYFWGAISAMVTQSETEILDGFTRRYGFSIPDYLADLGGAFFPYWQQKYPPLQHVKMKMSYRASPFYLSGGTDLFEDYDGMTFWCSFNIRQLIPHGYKKYYPHFLWVAVGYGVDKVWTGPHRTRQLYLAIDFDFSHFPIRNRLIKSLLNLLDHIHLGAPTLQIYPQFKTYIYFY